MKQRQYDPIESSKLVAGLVTGAVMVGALIHGFTGCNKKPNNKNLVDKIQTNIVDFREAEKEHESLKEKYIVKSGDCLGKIAERHNMAIPEIKEINSQIKDFNNINVGDEVNIINYLRDEKKEEVSKKKLVENNLKNKTILGQYIYGESANQKEIVREAIGKTMLNRVGENGYKNSIRAVVLRDSRFTCVSSNKNKNWKQATGELERNEYEEMIYKRCLDDAEDVFSGKDLGYKNQDKWIAYFDSTTNYDKVCELDSYWKTLKPDVTIGDITFCVHRD